MNDKRYMSVCAIRFGCLNIFGRWIEYVSNGAWTKDGEMDEGERDGNALMFDTAIRYFAFQRKFSGI